MFCAMSVSPSSSSSSWSTWARQRDQRGALLTNQRTVTRNEEAICRGRRHRQAGQGLVHVRRCVNQRTHQQLRRRTRMGNSTQPNDPGRGWRNSKRAISLRRRFYSPALVAFSCCILKAISFGFKPAGVLMTCTMLGFTVPFGPQTLFDTVPACVLIGLLLYFTSRMEMDRVLQALIAVGGLVAIFLSWKLQGPIPNLPRRIPEHMQQRLKASMEKEMFKERTVKKQKMGGNVSSVGSRGLSQP